MSGARALSRFARASDATCWRKTLVNPTIRGRQAITRSRQSSRKRSTLPRASSRSSKLRGDLRLHPQDFRRKCGPRRLQHAVKVTFGIRTDLWKERAREDPLARKRAGRSGMGGHPVESRANLLGKPKAEVQRLRGDATRSERSLEQAKSDRRREERTERHADEHDVGRRATAYTVSGDRERRRLTPLVRAHTAHHSRVERWCR